MQVPESHVHDLEAIIRSRTPLVVIESDEEPEVLALVQHISKRLQIKGFRWTVTEGLQAFDAAHQPAEPVEKAIDVLGYIKTIASHALFALLDFHPVLKDSVHVRLLKDIALSYGHRRNTVILVSHQLELPRELRPFAGFFRLPLPTVDELRAIVYQVASEWAAENCKPGVETTNKVLELLVRNLAGLTATDARRLARKAISDNGVISPSTLPEVMRAKHELLGQDGVLVLRE